MLTLFAENCIFGEMRCKNLWRRFISVVARRLC